MLPSPLHCAYTFNFILYPRISRGRGYGIDSLASDSCCKLLDLISAKPFKAAKFILSEIQKEHHDQCLKGPSYSVSLDSVRRPCDSTHRSSKLLSKATH